MTYNDIVAEILGRLNLTSSEATTRVGGLVNRLYKQVTTAIGMQFSRRHLDFSANTSEGSATLTFTSCEKLTRVWDPTGGTKRFLRQVTLDELRDLNLAASDTPTRWAELSVTATSVTIQLDTVAQSVKAYSADGYGTAATLDGTMEPAFPESFHDILVEGVLVPEYRKAGKRDDARDSQALYDGRLSDLRMWYTKSGYLKTRQGERISSLVTSTGAGSGGGGGAIDGTQSYTQSGLITFDRGAGEVPFAVAEADAPYVPNLIADRIEMSTARLVGRTTAGSGRSEEVATGTGLSLAALVLAVDTTVVPLKTDNLGVFGATTSAELANIMSDETGSGALVFGTSPTIAAPSISGGTLAGAAVSGGSVSGSIAGTPTWGGAHTFSAGLTTGADIVHSANNVIRRSTSDGSDNGSLEINGGGGSGSSRGGGVGVFGNEHATKPGYWDVQIGNVSGSHGVVRRADGTAALDILGSDGSLTATTSKTSGAWVFNGTGTNGGQLGFQRAGTDLGYIGSAKLDTSSVDGIVVSSPSGKDVWLHSGHGTNPVLLDHIGSRIDGTFNCGDSSHRWANVWSANGTIQTSDLRQKTIVGPSLGLAFINSLKPFAYTWRRGDGRTRYGLGAQDVLELAPELVDGSERTSYGLNYAEFVAPLVRAVQELSTRFDTLEQKGH